MSREVMQQALEALIWASGSEDFAEGGVARKGALKLLFPAIDALHVELSKPAAVPDKVTCPDCSGVGGHRWLEPDGSENGERCSTCSGFGEIDQPPAPTVDVEAVREVIKEMQSMYVRHWARRLCRAIGGRHDD